MNISCFLVAGGPRNEADIISVAKKGFPICEINAGF